jgi:nitrogen-specific signal transduction histidine kinase
VIAHDVIERRMLEKQNRQLQKVESIGRLAGGIAHDFNNVIGAVMGWAQIGFAEAPAESRLRSHFKKICDQAERAAGLTRQLLAFARRQILEPHNINLNQTIAEVVSMLEKTLGAQIEVKTVPAQDLAPAFADATQVEQVLMNLCLNARDAMPQGGTLLIETQNAQIDEEYCRLRTYARPGRYVLLSVSDTGVGLDAGTLERIFEPFFTTKEPGRGTGLGLAMVYGIVKQHGGFIHVYSEPGQGTTFRVYFPAGVGAAEEQKKPEPDQVPGGAETILVVEDHGGMRAMAREELSGLGYEVLLARDGEEAVRLFDSKCDRVALVVLDVVIPKLNGPNAYVQMSARKPGLPAIFTTGYSAEMGMLTSMLERGTVILQKPYTPASLGRKVREVLDASSRQPSPGDLPGGGAAGRKPNEPNQ